MEENIIKTQGDFNERMSVNVETKFRTYFSIQHIQSAALFSRLAYNIEKKYDGKFDEELITQHKAYVSNAIISSVSCLEANINELFSDMTDDKTGQNDNKINSIDPAIMQLMRDMWNLNIPRTASYSIVEKYEIALALARKDKIDKSSSIYGNIKVLIQLRNALVHYEPEWIDSPENLNTNIHTFEQKLRGKFELNPLAGSGNPFYPNKSLSHGCAEWGCKSCIDFIDSFSTKMRIISRFDHVRSKLITR